VYIAHSFVLSNMKHCGASVDGKRPLGKPKKRRRRFSNVQD